MRINCPNKCKLSTSKSVLTTDKDGFYYYKKFKPPFCPHCGSMTKSTYNLYSQLFETFNINKKLDKTVQLFLKSEFEAAARDAFITLETEIRKTSGLTNLHGKNLVASAFTMDYDKGTMSVTKPPLIKLNDLSTESEINEQEGIKLMLMGFFQGPRNIYQHNKNGHGPDTVLPLILDVSMFLDLINGHSMTKKAHWIKSTFDPNDIYKKMPRKKDRIRFIFELRRNQNRKIKK